MGVFPSTSDADSFAGLKRTDVLITGLVASGFEVADALQDRRPHHGGFLTEANDGRDAQSGAHWRNGMGIRSRLNKNIAGEHGLLLRLLAPAAAFQYLDSGHIDHVALTGQILASGLFLPYLGMHDIPGKIGVCIVGRGPTGG